MFDLTMTEYWELIGSLKYRDFILFYFALYLFVESLQRALGISLETNSQIRVSPKVLPGLILLHLLTMLHGYWSAHIYLGGEFGLYIFTGLTFFALVYLIELVFLSESGLLRLIYLPRLSEQARRRIDIFARNKNNQVRVVNEPSLHKFLRREVESSRKLVFALAVDSYVCFYLVWVTMTTYIGIGIALILFCILFLLPQTIGMGKNFKIAGTRVDDSIVKASPKR